MGLNHCVFEGRMTRDAELSTTQSGIEYTSFTVAVDRYVGKDKERKADFIHCRAWRGTAAFINKYFHKGDPIIITGSIETSQYEDKETGKKRESWNVDVEQAMFVLSGKRSDSDGGDNPFTAQNSAADELAEDDGPLPF